MHKNKAFLGGESSLLEVYEVGYRLHKKEKGEKDSLRNDEEGIEMMRAFGESLARIAAIRRTQKCDPVVPQRLFN